MAVITKLVLGAVVKFGAKKLTTKAVKSTAKLKINSVRLRTARAFLVKRARTIGDIAAALTGLGLKLAEHWGGKDYEVHDSALKEVCQACKDMEDAVYSCGNYLEDAAVKYDEAQDASKSQASGLQTAR